MRKGEKEQQKPFAGYRAFLTMFDNRNNMGKKNIEEELMLEVPVYMNIKCLT